MPPNSDLVLQYMSRAAHREHIASLPDARTEAARKSDAGAQFAEPYESEEDSRADWDALRDVVAEDRANSPRRVIASASVAERQPDAEPSQDPRDTAPESDRGWCTITEEIGESRSWHSFKAVKREIGPVEGTEVHHIVEQSQAKPERSGFPAEQINSSDNLTRLPETVHREISAEYSRKGLNPAPLRDMLDGLPWDEQYEIGCAMIDEKMRSHDDRDA